MGLELHEVSAGYNRRPVVRNLSLAVERGDSLAIVGRNGAGKTTTLRAIMRSEGVQVRGEIRVDGRSLAGMQTEAIARLGISLVPGDRRVFPLSVRENLQLACRNRKQYLALLEEVLSILPQLKAHLDQRADTLSGGEQQMLAVARAAMTRPHYLLLDEPTEGLSPQVVHRLVRGLSRMKAEWKIGIIVVERNARFLEALCTSCHVLARGSIVRSDTVARILAEPDGAPTSGADITPAGGEP
jgi:branched-chain amino acid transport system ATP-binding protein